MAKGEADRDVELVRKAILSGLSNCLEWIDDRAAMLVRNNPENEGLTPEGIKQLLVEFVRGGGAIERRKEERPHFQGRREFWYCSIVPVSDIPHGLFVEMELSDDDPDVPVVSLLNAHPQRR